MDDKILGKEKDAASIITSKGKDRYEFALTIIQSITGMEKVMRDSGPELSKENKEREMNDQLDQFKMNNMSMQNK